MEKKAKTQKYLSCVSIVLLRNNTWDNVFWNIINLNENENYRCYPVKKRYKIRYFKS